MRVWIDITNSPHVLFFRPIITALQNKGISCLVTCREHSQTIDLLEKYKINFRKVGSHSGSSTIRKALGFYTRNRQLYKILKHESLDVAVCHQSPYAMHTAKSLGIKRRIYIFDNDKSKLQNWLGIRNSTCSMCPEIIKGNHIKYKGLKEALYLYDFKPNFDGLRKLNIDKFKYVIFRPEPWSAQYYKGRNNIFESICNEIISNNLKLVILPRDQDQRNFFYKKVFPKSNNTK